MIVTKRATVVAGAPVKRECVQCGGPFYVRLSGPGRSMQYCSRACQQAAYRERHAVPPEQLRRLAEAAMQELRRRLPEVGVDAVPDDQLAALTRQVKALLSLLPQASAAVATQPLGVAEQDPVADVREPVAPAAGSVDVAATVGQAPQNAIAGQGELLPVPATVPRLVDGVRPTDQQQAILDAIASGDALVVEAGAGTGKTSTLVMAAKLMPRGRRGLYVAFNKSVQVEARAKFPRHVHCSTQHALAYRAVGHRYERRMRETARVPARQAAAIMGITADLTLSTTTGRRSLSPASLAQIAGTAVERYCRSADRELAAHHVPKVPGIDGQAVHDLREYIVPVARAMWAELQGTTGRLRFKGDHYVKIWALTDPMLNYDVIYYDEAQDADPAMAGVIQSQQAQLIAVGDSCQAINGWRGAIDAMKNWPTRRRLPLTQSWRFGSAIADEANKWLDLLRSPMRLIGAPGMVSTVGTLSTPDAILCRTNAEAMAQAMKVMEEGGSRPALVGGGKAIRSMAEAAQELQAGMATSHPELAAFGTWGEVQDYVDTDESASDLAVFVRLVDEHGPSVLIHAVDSLVDEKRANVIISTAHKAKGREWRKVRIGGDFRRPKATEEGRAGKLPDAEAMLAYVSVTRAQNTLDLGGLSWIDEHLAGVPAPSARRRPRMTDDSATFWS